MHSQYMHTNGHYKNYYRETKTETESEREMEANSCENGNVRFLGEEAVEEDEEAIKRRILGHPLYELLIETHLNCLKVGLGDTGEVGVTTKPDQADTKVNAAIFRPSDLDHFMEEYCVALGKLKEAMENPIQETSSFINGMYDQLRELSGTNPTHAAT